MKKILVFVIMLTLLSVFAFADGSLAEGGIGPDSPFYFVDQFFDQFADDLEVKEERISEIKAMIEAGDIESAKIALNGYYEYAEELEKEVSPQRREEVLKSAAIIKEALAQLETQIPEDHKDEFVNDILNQETNIETAAEIASKINELCTELAQLDPAQYYEVCKTNEDSPKWQQELHEDLTNEQIEEAKKFGEIMSQCFASSGQDCKCEEIPYKDFADVCSQAAPLAVACDIEGNDDACDELDQLDMPDLPDHLQDVFDQLEEDVIHSKYDLHMPDECVEAGVTNPDDCGRVMVELYAPEECKQALLDADVKTEHEGRAICDEIMMEIHAPECAAAGITDPAECDEFYKEHYDGGEYGDEQYGSHDSSFNVDFDCQDIEDSTERLDCYDLAATQVNSFGGYSDENYAGPCMTESDWEVKKAECRDLYGDNAGDEPIMGDSGQGYECPIDIVCIDFGQYGDSGNCMDENDWAEKKAECRSLYGDNAGDEPIMGDSGQGYDCPVDITCIDFGQYEDEYVEEEFKESDDWMEGCDVIYCPENTYCAYGECIEHPYSECSDGCDQECGDQNTDCVDDMCVCLGYGENGPPPSSDAYEERYEDETDYNYEDDYNYDDSSDQGDSGNQEENDQDYSGDEGSDQDYEDDSGEDSHDEPEDSGSDESNDAGSDDSSGSEDSGSGDSTGSEDAGENIE